MTEPSYCPFVVGDHVVCVDAAPIAGCRWVYGDPPIVGKVYTVAQVGIGLTGGVIVSVEEQSRHPDSVRAGYWGWLASRFRPAPSISALTELLHEQPAPAELEEA